MMCSRVARFARALASISCLAATATVGGGCGSQQARLQGGVYRDGPVAFRVGAAPTSWRAVRVDKATLAWRDEAERASILLDARCYRKDDDVPLVALTDHLMAGTTERTIGSQVTIPFDGREAMQTHVRARLDGVPMDYEIYVYKKDGCVYDFVYVAEPKGDAAGTAVPTFEQFVGTFHAIAESP